MAGRGLSKLEETSPQGESAVCIHRRSSAGGRQLSGMSASRGLGASHTSCRPPNTTGGILAAAQGAAAGVT